MTKPKSPRTWKYALAVYLDGEDQPIAMHPVKSEEDAFEKAFLIAIEIALTYHARVETRLARLTWLDP